QLQNQTGRQRGVRNRPADESADPNVGVRLPAGSLLRAASRGEDADVVSSRHSSGQRLCDAFQAADVGWIEGADICDEVSWRMALALSTSEDHHPSAATNCDRSTRNCSDRPVKLTSMAVHCAEPGTSTTAEGVADAA